VNRLFFDATAPEHFATLFLGLYDDATRVFSYVNCGHNAPVLARAAGPWEALPSTAPALGLMERWTARVERVDLREGDTLVIYSDGVTEARRSGIEPLPGEGDEEFGEDRLAASIQVGGHRPLSELPASILADVESFAGTAPQDDRTIVAMRVLAQPSMI
jgi:sigma-B regulation protein RsbU (phosphoserine phosphatase)